MCLKTLEPIPENLSGVGYKFVCGVRIGVDKITCSTPYMYTTLTVGTECVAMPPKNGRYNVDAGRLQLETDPTRSYKAGFHIYPTLHDARQSGWGREWSIKMAKVRYSEVTAYGEDGSSSYESGQPKCLVAQKMTVISIFV